MNLQQSIIFNSESQTAQQLAAYDWQAFTSSCAAKQLLESWMPAQRWFPQLAAAKPEIHSMQLFALQGEFVTESAPFSLAIAFITLADSRCFQLPLLLTNEAYLLEQASTAGGNIGVLAGSSISSTKAMLSGEFWLLDATTLELGRKALGQFFFAAECEITELHPDNEAQVRQDFNEITSAGRISAEQSNTSLIFHTASSNAYILKLFRQLSPGINPDVQIHQALQDQNNSHIATYYGSLIMHSQPADGNESQTAEALYLGLLTKFFTGVQDAWSSATEAAKHQQSFTDSAFELGQALASVHQDLNLALDSAPADAKTISQAQNIMRERLTAACKIEPAIKELEAEILKVYNRVDSARWPNFQRIHGDLHLGQILTTLHAGWIFLDFEGEPLRPLKQRLELDSPLRDLAGLLRSFDYAAGFVTLNFQANASQWAIGAREACLTGYTSVIPQSQLDLQVLHAFELDKAVYELVYELANRPSWAAIPRQAITRILGKGD